MKKALIVIFSHSKFVPAAKVCRLRKGMVLNMKIAENYMEKVYAGWLGKIIGIRLGAPIEGWTYQRIRDVFGEVWSYPANYKNFAADDDSNGPLFFIRALEDCKDLNNFSSHDVANALLNYAPYEHGFFWWGGYGISTEHTAYLNLRNGITAPRSGSIEQNGSTMAEQIGGQIFIDSWGLVSPNNSIDFSSFKFHRNIVKSNL